MNHNGLDFTNIYIERGDKETENFLSEEGNSFLQKKVSYLMANKEEFIYIESNSFNGLGVEGLCLEVDDVFGTYQAMLGFKLPKKLENSLKDYLNSHLTGDEAKYSLLFDHNEGLWNMNFTLNYVQGFSEEDSIGEALIVIYDFLTHLKQEVK